MDKSKVIKGLTKLVFLLPGNLKPAKYWFLSPWTLLSLFGLCLTFINAALEFIRCPSLLGTNSTDTTGPPPPPYLNDTCVDQGDMDPQHDPKLGIPPSLIVKIVLTGQQIFTFFINVVVRLVVIVSFPKIRALIECLNSSTNDRTYLNKQRWIRAWVKWSNDEKIFLAVFVTSVIGRELDIIACIYDAIRRQCSFFFVAIRILQDQSQVWFSLDAVIEIATLTLLSFLNTFVNIFEEVCKEGMGYPISLISDDEDRSTKLLKSSLQIPHGLFQKNNQISSKCQSIGGHTKDYREDLSDLFFETLDHNLEKTLDIKKAAKVNNRTHPEVGIHDEIEGTIGLYFETLSLWRYASGLTGILTLIIFMELTLKFCLVTFAGLAAASQHGLMDLRFLSAFLRGIIIMAKMTCVTHLAQALPDSTHLLADKILKMRWKSVGGNQPFLKKPTSGSINCKNVPDNQGFRETMLSHVIKYIANNPLTLSAMGYFQVSKSSVITVAGVIVTYLVVLIQFHVQMIQNSRQNTTSINLNGSTSV